MANLESLAALHVRTTQPLPGHASAWFPSAGAVRRALGASLGEPQAQMPTYFLPARFETTRLPGSDSGRPRLFPGQMP